MPGQEFVDLSRCDAGGFRRGVDSPAMLRQKLFEMKPLCFASRAVPDVASRTCLVRISAVSNPRLSDVSDAFFSISH